jgi:hypothetical protein
MDIHSHIYLLINDNGPLLALCSTGKCAKGPMYHLSGISEKGVLKTPNCSNHLQYFVMITYIGLL